MSVHKIHILSVVTGFLLLALAMPSHAGAPFNVDDPGTTEAQHYALDLSFASSQVRGSESQQTPSLSLSYGLTDTIEVGIGGFGATSVRETGSKRVTGFGDIAADIRWRFQEETKNRPQFGLGYVLKIPTASESKGLGSGSYDHQIYTMGAKSFGRYTVCSNIGYNVLGAQGSKNNWFYGVASTFQSTEKLTLGAQLYGNSASEPGGKSELAYGVGASYNYAPDQTWMLSVGRSTQGMGDLNVMAIVEFTFGPKAKPEAGK